MWTNYIIPFIPLAIIIILAVIGNKYSPPHPKYSLLEGPLHKNVFGCLKEILLALVGLGVLFLIIWIIHAITHDILYG